MTVSWSILMITENRLISVLVWIETKAEHHLACEPAEQ